jgi:hypothetical protein
MAHSKWLNSEEFGRLSGGMRAWIRELDTRAHTPEGVYYQRPHIEERLGIGRKRTIPKHVAGRYALPGTDYQFQVYASGTAPTRARHRRKPGVGGMKRVFAICPDCGKEVEAGHVRQHGLAHLTTEVKALLK